MELPDNYDLYRRHEAEQEAALDELPRCCECHKPITDDRCWVFDDEPICDECARKNHRKWTEDLIGG